MRIAYVTNSFPNAFKPYAGINVARHVDRLRQIGVDVLVLAPLESRRGLLRRLWKYGKLAIQALHTALFRRFDLVHAHWPFPAGVMGAALAWVRRRPLVVTSRGTFVDDYDHRGVATRWLVRWVLRRADLLIAVSRAHAVNVARVSGRDLSAIQLIDAGIAVPAQRLGRREARQALGLSLDGLHIVYIGNLRMEKGPDVLIAALLQLARRNIRFHAYVAGQGEMLEQLSEQASLAPAGAIQFIGGLDPQIVPTWLAAADICVMPSRREARGQVALEAMVNGCAVVASAVGGLLETVTDGITGVLVPPGDPDALSACLAQLAGDESLRQRMTSAALETARTFDLRNRVDQLTVLYRALVPREGKAIQGSSRS